MPLLSPAAFPIPRVAANLPTHALRRQPITILTIGSTTSDSAMTMPNIIDAINVAARSLCDDDGGF